MKNPTFSPRAIRLPASMLVASFLAFSIVILSAIVSFTNVGVFENITPQQMATIRVGWSVFPVCAGLAVLLGAFGVVLLSSILKETTARLFAWIALASGLGVIVLCLLFIILRVSVTTFTETTLGLNSNYQLSDWSFSRLAAPLSMVATFFASISLFTTRLLRRTGLVVAVLSGILFILSIAVGFPPFVFAFLWLMLGLGLFLRKGEHTDFLPHLSH
jgi:hypothetical protein